MAKALGTLVGSTVSEIHTETRPPGDVVTLGLGKSGRLEVDLDALVPLGDDDWDDYWTDFEDFLGDGPDDLEPEALEGEVISLADLLDRTVTRVRTGLGSKGNRYVVLDLSGDLSLLMPAARSRLDGLELDHVADFDRWIDDEVSAAVAED